MSNNTDRAVATLKELIALYTPAERKEFAAAISGCFAAGELTSVGNSLSAAATAEEARVKLTAIEASNTSSNAVHLVRNLMSRAERHFGFVIQPSVKVNLRELDSCIRASREKLSGLAFDNNVDEAFKLKTDLATMGMI